jgi:phospholipid-binding lipoprotein MlaA
LGVGGLFDIAGPEGFDDQPEDFGQTLAVWGVPHGPYMVPPLWAPGSLRDHTGNMIDGYVDPVRLWLSNTDQDGWMITRSLFGVFDQRVQLVDALEDLKRSSIDYYAAVRSAYGQHRAGLVADDGQDSVDIPNYAAGEE